MAKTIVFKPEFEKKLNDLKIKTEFVKNLGNRAAKYADKTINFSNWKDFIDCAFIWNKSKEGHEYWKNISYS